jgi:NADH-quinone oxidoreductase subunit C
MSESPSEAAPAVDPLIAAVQEYLGGRLRMVTEGADCPTVEVDRDDLLDLATFLRDDPTLQFVRLVDVCGVDYLALDQTPRFATVYHLHSLALNRYVRLRVRLDEDDPVVPSLTGLWPGANFFERETYDLMGIRFTGHPDLKRLLLPDDWEGHPLRKDYVQPFEPVEFSFNPDQWQEAVQRGD